MEEIKDEDKIPFNLHTDHHRWVHGKLEDEKIEKERKDKIKTSLITAGIFSFFTSLAGVIWYAVQMFVANGGK